jgi:hypothetical protein
MHTTRSTMQHHTQQRSVDCGSKSEPARECSTVLASVSRPNPQLRQLHLGTELSRASEQRLRQSARTAMRDAQSRLALALIDTTQGRHGCSSGAVCLCVWARWALPCASLHPDTLVHPIARGVVACMRVASLRCTGGEGIGSFTSQIAGPRQGAARGAPPWEGNTM